MIWTQDLTFTGFVNTQVAQNDKDEYGCCVRNGDMHTIVDKQINRGLRGPTRRDFLVVFVVNKRVPETSQQTRLFRLAVDEDCCCDTRSQ